MYYYVTSIATVKSNQMCRGVPFDNDSISITRKCLEFRRVKTYGS